nr:hypothetical protein [Tanacetum cinerariifolium]
MGRDTIQFETAVSTISQEYLLEFTSEYGISEDLHPEFLGPEERIVDFLEGKVGVYTKFFEFANFRLPISQFLFDILDMDLLNLIHAPNPTKVKIGTRPRAAHEVLLLTVTSSRVIEMEDPAAATESSGTPSTIKMSSLDFANENPSQQSTRGDGTKDQGQETMAPEVPPSENVMTMGVVPERGLVEEIFAMGPRVIKKHRKGSTVGGKSLASMRLETGSTFPVPTPQETPADVSDPDPLSFTKPQSVPVVQVGEYLLHLHGRSPESTYQPEWGVTNGCRLNTSEACQDLVDHVEPPGYFSKTRHLHNDDFLSQYNINLARQVAMGSQLRLRFEQEAKLLKKSVAQVARRDKRVQARENEIKNLEALLEAETDMKKPRRPRTQSLSMSWKTSALSLQTFKWVIGHGLCLAVMKCGESTELRQVFADVVSARIAKGMTEGLKYGVEHGKANLDLEAIEAYGPNADTKYVTALHALTDLNDSGEDAPQWIRELHPSSSQLKIPTYPEVRDLKDPWSFKEEILLEDAIAANVSRVEKKKECWVVCHTHGVGFAHHARSDGVPVSVPTVAPQGLAILLADAATQTETFENEASPRFLRSKSLPAMYNLDWP